jgi:hypothetical protein
MSSQEVAKRPVATTDAIAIFLTIFFMIVSYYKLILTPRLKERLLGSRPASIP